MTDWDIFRETFVSCSDKLGANYFQIPRYGALPTWRERAYCYELYHQLRTELVKKDLSDRYLIHGEIDKGGHDWFLNEFNNKYNEIKEEFVERELLADSDYVNPRPNPDFIVHVPGSIDNLVVIEVKALEHLTRSSAIKDIIKLRAFTEMTGGYNHGIFLIFGDDSVNESRQQLLNLLNGCLNNKINIYLHTYQSNNRNAHMELWTS